MIIKKLILHNFGIYAGDNVFSFKKTRKKTVTLIGGMNGRGKTTFLEAVLLALYGSNSFAVIESKYKTYGHYLRAHTNIEDGTKDSFVELEFSMNEENDNNIYIINRSWNSESKHLKDKVSVRKNDVEDKFLAQNWGMFIESILPSGLANFFFFDGEKIAELAEGETNPQMKNSIKVLLGINVIDLLQNDLTRVIKKLENEQVDEYSATKIDELRALKDDKGDKLIAIDNEIKELEFEIAKTDTMINSKKESFEAKGGYIADQSKELFSEHVELKSKLEQIQSHFVDLAATELPLILVKPLLNEILEQSMKERESKSMSIAVNRIAELFKMYSLKKKDNGDVSDFINFVVGQTERSSVDVIFDLSENTYAQGSLLLNHQLENLRENYISDKEKEEKMMIRRNEIDNYLSVDIDEKAIQRIYKRICELENKKIQLKVLLESKSKERSVINGEFLKATTEFNRCVEHSLQTMEREDDIKRLSGYALLAQRVSEHYKTELQRAKVQELADTMTECYKKLLGKQKLIDKIEMDHETLDYRYIDKKGNEIAKSVLSAGEKQLMVISMLWALGICSRKKLPIIIDTPLARLDSAHRTALINKYFPKASDQTIILSTDAEIDSTYYDIIHKHIGNEFTLIYDEDTKCSTIEEGYFKGVIGC